MTMTIDAIETHRAAAASMKRAGTKQGVRTDLKNLKFANDGSLESVDQMLHKIAGRCYRRVMAMGLPMELDDIIQEMRVSYLLAKSKWDSQAGSLFSTYCNTVCMNNFNNTIRQMERQRTLGKIEDTVCKETGVKTPPKFQRVFGLISECELHSQSSSDINDSFESYTDRVPGNAVDEPHFRLEHAQETKRRMANLSAGAKKIISLLLQNENQSVSPAPRLRQIAEMARIDGRELKRVKLEILKTYGVTWP